GRNRENVLPECPVAVVVQAIAQIGSPHSFIRLSVDPSRKNCLDLAGDEQLTIFRSVIVERLYTETVSRGKQRLLPLIPYRKRKHPDEVVETRIPPLLVRGEQHLGVAAGSELKVALQLSAQLDVVVYLPIESYPEPAMLISHRLCTRFRQVDNAQAVVSETREHFGIDVSARRVWSAVLLYSYHRFELVPAPSLAKDSCYAAHFRNTSRLNQRTTSVESKLPSATGATTPNGSVHS